MSQETQEIAVVSKTDAMMAINDAVSNLSAMSGGLPEIQDNLRIIFENARELVRQVSAYEATVIDAEHYIDRVEAERNELLKQRDAVLDEFHTLLTNLKAGKFWDTDDSQEIFEAAVEEHNEAFWQSLPYDIASKIGGDWKFYHADLLNDAITAWDDEEFAEGRDMPIEAIQNFKKKLLELVEELRDQEGSL